MNKKYTLFYAASSPFSQHHRSKFEIDGMYFTCCEQYMMYQKAVIFKDDEAAKNILCSKDPREMKKLGRQVKNFDKKIWEGKCQDVVRRANLAKFSQNEKLRKDLMATRGTTLVEASRTDCKWGIGLDARNRKALDKANWRGKNLLGYILTEIRESYFCKE